MSSDGSVVILIEGDDTQFEKTLGGLGETAKAAGQAVATAFTGAAAGVAALAKSSLDSYAAFEQLTGGIETLFKDSNRAVMDFANNAYKTAGLSANAYMETVTGFSASLIASLGGDTAKAADTADRAITDMADNANKMGTAIGSIQYAYQGFAKQNYTMLDNLKLGYGGTKKEMERLLADAKKLSGIEYDISSFADIVEAIHVVQVELGIAGATAAEAESTIEGSLAAMAAAWQNLVTGIADENQNLDTLINNFVTSVSVAAGNVLPRIEVILGGIGMLAAQLAPTLVQAIPGIITQVVPGLAGAALELVAALVGGLLDNAPLMLDGALALMSNLGMYLRENLPALLETGLEMVAGLTASLHDNAGLLVDGALALILSLAQGLADALPTLLESVPEIVSNIANVINDNAPKLLTAAGVLIITLGKGLLDALPDLVANIPKIIAAIVDVWSAFNWLSLGTKAITAVKDGVLKMIGAVKTAGQNVTNTLVNAVQNLPTTLGNLGRNAVTNLANGIRNLAGTAKSAMQSVFDGILNTIRNLPNKMLDIGKYIVQGIANGIKNGASAALNAVTDLAERVLNKAKNALGIRSPSRVMRDEVGEMLPPGIGQGVERAMPALERSVQRDMEALSARMRDAVQSEVLTVSAQLSGSTTGQPLTVPAPGTTEVNINVTVTGGINETEARNTGRELGREAAREMRRRGLILA